MPHRSFFINITVAVLLFSISARSQEPTTSRGLDEAATAAMRKKATDLLESVAGQVNSLRSAENRARIGSNVAELLWSHDEKRARSLFTAVEEDIIAGFIGTDPDDARRNHTLMVFGQLRRDTLHRIAKHDPNLALAFLRATRPPTHIQMPPQITEGEKTLELRLASQIASENPQLALKLARQSLAKGFSPGLITVLSQLKEKDKDAAASFYKEIVDKFKSVNLALDPRATGIAVDLTGSFQPPEADEMVYRDLLGLLLTSALANGCAEAADDFPPQICLEIGSLVSKMENYFPARVGPLRRWAGRGNSHDGPAPEVWEEIREVILEGTVNEILALAVKYPDMQRQVYWAAVRKAEDSGDVARARQIASDFPDQEQRGYMLAQIDRDQMWKSMNAEKLAQIQQQVSGFRTNEERINFLLQMASQVGGSDRKTALGFLNQAAEIINSIKPGKTQLGGQIRLAMMYCSLQSDRGFTIMESLLPKLNELVTAAAALDGVENNYLRDGEWNMTGEGVVGGLLTNLAQNAGHFAALDFERSVSLAGQFERLELRLMAQLKLAQGVLAQRTYSVSTLKRTADTR